MAASRLIGATVVAVPSYFLLKCGKVSAESIKVHPRELDIYSEPKVHTALVDEDKEEDISALERHVSMVRQKIWDISDSFKDNKESIRNGYGTGKARFLEFVELLKTDQTFQMKVGAMSGATFLGIILAGRGRRPFRRILLGSTFGVAAASICYPNVAVDLSLRGYNKVKDAAIQQWEAYKSKAPEKAPEKLEQITSEMKEDETSVESSVNQIIDDTSVAEQEPNIEEKSSIDVELKDETLAIQTEEKSTVKTDVQDETQATQTEEKNKEVVELRVKDTTKESVSGVKSFLSSLPFYDKIMQKVPTKHSEIKTDDSKLVTGTQSSTIEQETKETTKSAKTEVEGDPGMSEVEDKDMYSTRS